MPVTMGAATFAERARREPLATGETVRRRTPETLHELTAQETSIARLARDGRNRAQGWLVKVKLPDPAEVDSLMSAEEYQATLSQ